ncbi:hypothetical protein ACPV47_10870 [Vibrio jasicida]|uniref:hypothetical protein n=1 Tax=Vibrio jasicida TaxID=766224 RepID=UPI004068C4C5
MINSLNIVAVDDELSQLDAIQNAFFSSGIPCLPIHYQYDLVNNTSGIDHVDTSNFHPRVVVSDLNLRNGSLGNTMELVTPIAKLLEKLAINGPYLLIFWSGVTEEVERVMELLQERFMDRITLPIHCCTIDKDQYLAAGANPDDLKNRVRELVEESSLLNALLDWEYRIIKSAQQTTNSLFNLTKPISVNPEVGYQGQHTSEIQKVLAKIGNETVGALNASESPEEAIDLGLAPVLHDQLNSISYITNSDKWRNGVPQIGTDVNVEQDLATKLNSFYHIEVVKPSYSKACRGVFIELEDEVLQDTSKLEKLESRFGITLRELIDEEFLLQIVRANNRDLVRGSTKLGFIEISAECDQAQKKTKLHRYVIAALTPLDFAPEGETPFNLYGKQNKKSHNGIYRVPDINIDGVDYMLQLSFKYQIGSLPSENKWLGRPLFRLRDQIMVDISFNCAQYISRPGIIAFK